MLEHRAEGRDSHEIHRRHVPDSQIESAIENVEVLTRKLADHEKTISELETELRASRNQLLSIESQASDRDHQIARLEARNEELTDLNNSLQVDIAIRIAEAEHKRSAEVEGLRRELSLKDTSLVDNLNELLEIANRDLARTNEAHAEERQKMMSEVCSSQCLRSNRDC